MLRLTVDTIILVAGLTFPDSKPRTLLELARAGEIELAVSNSLLEETADVLAREFDWPEADIQEARRQLGLFAISVTATAAIDAVKDDPDDNSILECAIAAGSQYVVSGDRHLLQMGAFRGVRVLKVSDFLEVMAQEKERSLETPTPFPDARHDLV